jgi:iron complex outermembrane receptor protein
MNVVTRSTVLGLLLLWLLVPLAGAQNATVRGTVTDAQDGAPLPGANVVVLGASGNMVTGAATNLDGEYQIAGIPAGTYTVRGRYVGYQDTDVSVTLAAGEVRTVDLQLSQTGFELNTVIITASRRQEKALDAPAAISVLGAEEIAQNVSPSSDGLLRNTTGVDVAQTGVDRTEIVLRGFNNAFSGSAYVLTDYRQAAVPSLGVNIYSIMPNLNIDLDRVEVVRGPGSALYGAGVDAGVVHFISKDPFTHPGVTVSLMGGERSYFGGMFRAAGVVNEKLGVKVTGVYGQADDWELDPADALDAAQIAADGPRSNDYEKLNVNGTVEYRFSEKGSIIANGGFSQLKATVLSGIGTVQADGFGYSYGQLRFLYDRFFAQVYVNKNEAGDSFVYDATSPTPVVDKGALYNAQAQYDLSFADGKQQIILGVDAELIRPDTDGTILGRNEEDDSISEYGAYVQSTTALSPKLDLTLALRTDYNDIVDDVQLSPRAALVIKPTNTHTFRATYNRAFSSPGTNSNFLDIVAGRTSGITVRGRGVARGFTWERNAAYSGIAGTDLVASSLNGCFPVVTPACGTKTPVGLPLDAVYSSVYAGLSAIPTANLLGLLRQNGILVGVPDAIALPTVGQLVALLAPQATQVQGFSRGVMGIPSLSGGPTDIVADLTDISPLSQTTSQTFEVGYKGLWGNKVLFALDGYYSTKENFIGPLLVESPLVFVPTLSADLQSALATAIQNNALLNGALGGLGLNAAAVAGLLTNLAAGQLPGATTPVAIVQAIENNPGQGAIPELMLAYRNFGKLDFWGVDASMQVLATEELSLFGNLSFVSDDFFDNTELEETNTALAVALNSPAFKLKLGGSYMHASGFSVNLAGRYTDGFPVESGPYVGNVESSFKVDVGAGYDFSGQFEGLRLDVNIANALNDEHREFIGAPRIGRQGLARLTFSF